MYEIKFWLAAIIFKIHYFLAALNMKIFGLYFKNNFLAIPIAFIFFITHDILAMKNDLKSNVQVTSTLMGEYSIVPLTFNDKQEAEKVLNDIEVDVSPRAFVHDLSFVQREMVEMIDFEAKLANVSQLYITCVYDFIIFFPV